MGPSILQPGLSARFGLRPLRLLGVQLCVSAVILGLAGLPARADYDRALESYLKEDYIQAASKFDRFISRASSHPKLPLAVYYAAMCRLKLDQPKPAIDRLEYLLTAAPDSAESPSPAMVRLALGLAYRMIGDDTAALTYFESSWLSAANVFERAAAREKIKESKSIRRVGVSLTPIREIVRDDPDPLPARGSFAVQLVSSPDRSQAESIRSQVEADGWPVYQETADIKGETFYRIRVGPYETESEAKRAKDRLRSKFGLEGWVTRK